MKLRKEICFGIFLVFLLFFSGSVSAYMSSKVQGINVGFSSNLSASVCQEGQDLIVQISPFGCTPAVVRTDLLEENDVPVFCKISATQINPLIDIESIDSISFSGIQSKEISGIGFHPAKSALGVKKDLNVPSLDNIGYVVINLKKQSNASAIPDYVSGTLTAKIKYNINEAFGIGSALFYLPELTEEEWEVQQSQYGFWNGKGTLRASDITSNGASVSLYSNDNLISMVTLEKGKSSETIYLPGFECKAGLKIQLSGLENPDTRARLRINSEVAEIAKGEKFLDNKCQVTSLQGQGLVQKVGIKCQADKGTKNFILTLNPQLILNVDGENEQVGLGQKLYDREGKSVYVGYIGTEKNSEKQEDLFVYLVSMSQRGDSNLSSAELSSINSLVKNLIGEQKNSGIIDDASNFLKSIGGGSSLLSRFIGKGQSFYRINFADKSNSFSGGQVSITGLAGAQDEELSSEILEQYENAKEDYETIAEGYSTENYDGVTTYGEEALYREIILAWGANQKRTALDLCTEFEEAYPNSNKKIEECADIYQLANKDSASVYVTINGEPKKISFDGIYEPTFEEYGARVILTTSNGDTPFDLRKDEIMYLPGSGSDYIQLLSLDDDEATIRISVTSGTTKTQTIKLTPDTAIDFTTGYSFTLSDIHLQKIAKISVIPNIKNAGTETNFSFKIGIEKRAFQLSPEKTKETVNNLNKTIKQWEGISSNLGGIVEGLKTGCFITGAALIAKNLALGTGGTGIARQKVMRNSNGWNEKCASMVAVKTYSSLDECFIANAEKIDGDVEKLGGLIDSQNSKIKTLEQGYSKQSFLTEQVVDTDKFMESYSSQVNNYLSNSNIDGALIDPTGKVALSKEKILSILTAQGYEDRIYTTEQLREIELYTSVLNDDSASSELKDLAIKSLHSNLAKIQTSNENYLEVTAMANNLGVASSKVGFIEMGEKVKAVEYTGLTLGSVGKNINGYGSDTPIYVAPASDGNKYLFILDNTAGINLPIKRENNVPQIYYYDTEKIVNNPSKELTNLYFKKFDSTSYNNEYKNAKVSYYETEPYKGLPAIVPFDLVNGWYSATKPTIAAGNNIASYDASARVTSFYLCNVGENGLEENIGGDDICEMINTGTGQAYNKFPGIESETEAKRLIDKGIQAIEQARTSGSSSSGKINILGNLISVGSPAVDTPQFQCQDFMSPKECLLIFNLCDPVICPSSRCDLGGAYPVKDVVQTGIIGSIALCLPNFQEGIVMPVCLTGVKAGIDGLLSVQKSYRDCLQESLTTGKMVGICDEVYSVYLCDFVWKQALPFADMIVPKIMELVAGQNVRGGGEYLGVSSAWDNAESSINYFTNYYGANAKTAFNLRTTEGIQSEVCKVYTSSVVPSGADILSSLTASDSPVQFTGRFDEIPFTTATSPPTSHYKVYYHIYAGKDSGAYYQVYLKGSSTSTYYKDTQQNLMIASGYVAVDGYASDTPDKIATSGYKELCINVNGQEECGFQEVSTDFAINYIKDQYLKSETTKTDIISESECISGSANLYTVLNPNVQSGAESLIDPEIYNRGVLRYCATENPGKGTDPYAGTENARFVEVGYCDNENVKCWLDTESVEDVIKTTTVEGEALDEISNNYVDILSESGDYLTSEQFSAKVQNITKDKDAGNRIGMINEIFEKTFFSNQRVQLLYLRGNAYTELLNLLFGQRVKEEVLINTETGKETVSETDNEILELNDARQRVLAAAEKLDGTIVPGRGLDIKSGLGTTPSNYNCLSSAYYVYQYSNVLYSCVYSDKYADKYTLKLSSSLKSTIRRGAITDLREYTIAKSSTKTTRTISIGVDKRPDKNHATWIPNSRCNQISKLEKLDSLQPGDFILYVWSATMPSDPSFSSLYEDHDHAAIFIRWVDKANGIAELFDWNGAMYKNGWGVSLGEKDKNGKVCSNADEYYNKEKRATKFCAVYRYYQVDLSDDAHPVYLYQSPYLSGESLSGNKDGIETITTNKDPQEDIFDQGYNPITTPKINIGDKVYTEAEKLTANKYVSSAEFVSRSMMNAGITTLGVRSLITLIDGFEKQTTDFVEIDNSYLKPGDIVLLGKGCNIFSSIGIFAGWDIANKKVLFYNYEGKVVLKSESTSTIFGVNDNIYIYRAYRYVGDLTTEEKNVIISPRIKWTKEMALGQISSTPLTGNYNNNKNFIDQLIMDGLFEEEECGAIGINNFFGFGQKDIKWIESILKNKPSDLGHTPWIEAILKQINAQTTDA